jgi:hypothetical protein
VVGTGSVRGRSPPGLVLMPGAESAHGASTLGVMLGHGVASLSAATY